MLMRYMSLLVFISFNLLSCSGYRLKQAKNPLEIYGINAVSIPMFINLTALPNVSASMTAEIYKLLSSYSHLRVYGGESSHADAILIGILNSEKSKHEVVKTQDQTFINDPSLKKSIGNRNQFYVPTSVKYKLSLRLVLIKDPTTQDIELLKGKYADHVRVSRILFNHVIGIDSAYGKVLQGTSSADEGGLVNYTRNKALFEKNWQQVSANTAQHVRDVILEAF